MTKQEFKAARYDLCTDLRVTANELIDALAARRLRIVPSEPKAVGLMELLCHTLRRTR